MKIAQDAAMIVTERTKMINDKYNEAGIPTELERINASKAKPATECVYPNCEECDKYHGHYCTVPIVVTKQMWIEAIDRFADLSKRISDIEEVLLDEILSSKKASKSRDEVNFTWDDYLGDTDAVLDI